MTALTLISGDGGGQAAARPCPVCGTGHRGECRILARHLAWMEQRGLAASTRRNRVSQVLLLAAALDVAVLDATSGDLARWRAGLRLEPGGVCNAVSHVRQLFQWAIGEGLADADPARDLPVPRRPRRYPRPIPRADLLAALEAAPRRIRPWLVLAAWAGFRAVEVALLRAECVRLDASPPVIVVAADATKGRYERIVPASAFVAAELRAYGIPASGYMFRDKKGRPNQPHNVSHLANAYLRSQGITAEFHQLRHYALTCAYQGSLDIRAVQALAGHRSPDSTAIYTAYADASLIAAVNAIPAPPRRKPIIGS